MGLLQSGWRYRSNHVLIQVISTMRNSIIISKVLETINDRFTTECWVYSRKLSWICEMGPAICLWFALLMVATYQLSQ